MRRYAKTGTALLKRAALGLGLAGNLYVAAPAAEPLKLVLSAGRNAPALAFAQQLCALVNQPQRRLDIACEAQEGAGDVADLQALDGEAVHVVFARADLVRQAAAGTGPFRDRGPVRGSGRQRSGGPDEELRTLFALQIETFVVLARTEAAIKAPSDLAGKRLNIGPPGGDGRLVYETLAPALGWRLRDFGVAAELGPAAQIDALCRGRVDAIFLLAAHPDAALRGAAQACETAPLPLAGRAVEALDKADALLQPAPIPGGLYRNVPRDVPSLGLPIVAAASGKVDPRAVQELMKVLFDNLPRLQRADPVLARLELRRMIGSDLGAPPHEGAARFYKERGWSR